MKKHLNLIGFVIALAMIIISCDFRDKGLLEIIPVNEIVIDTAGIPVKLVVSSGDTLKVAPNISRVGGNLSYQWRISRNPGVSLADYILLDTSKHLNAVITALPSADTYTLWLRVEDKDTRLISGFVWLVLVEPPLNQGLVVADSDDGINSDLTIIQDTLFTNNWNVDDLAVPLVKRATLIRKNEFSRVHLTKFDGIIHSLFAQRLYQNGVYRNYLHGASKSNIFRINTIDYSIIAQGKDLFYDADVNLNIEHYYLNNNRGVIVNMGKLSLREPETRTGLDPYKRFGIDMPGNYVANKFIASHPTISSNAFYYDEVLGKFLRFGSAPNVRAQPLEAGAGTTPFQPTDMQGYTTLGAGIGNISEIRFVLKKNNFYGIYTMTSVGVPRRLLDISDAPGIEDAVSFVFPSDQAVIYYASGNTVYSIRIPQGGAITYTNLYSSPDPITKLEMLRRSGTVALAYSERCLLAITYNGSEGKITALPIPSTGLDLGIIDVSRKSTFGGFKKISAVAVQE